MSASSLTHTHTQAFRFHHPQSQSYQSSINTNPTPVLHIITKRKCGVHFVLCERERGAVSFLLVWIYSFFVVVVFETISSPTI